MALVSVSLLSLVSNILISFLCFLGFLPVESFFFVREGEEGGLPALLVLGRGGLAEVWGEEGAGGGRGGWATVVRLELSSSSDEELLNKEVVVCSVCIHVCVCECVRMYVYA